MALVAGPSSPALCRSSARGQSRLNVAGPARLAGLNLTTDPTDAGTVRYGSTVPPAVPIPSRADVQLRSPSRRAANRPPRRRDETAPFNTSLKAELN